jgi:hypothetical protein
LLYETAAPRQGEVLALNIADLGPRRAGAPWSSAGGRPSRGHRLGDQDCPLLPRHLHRLASLAIYAKPTLDAVAAATGALDPDRRR